jgi:guanine deaminase
MDYGDCSHQFTRRHALGLSALGWGAIVSHVSSAHAQSGDIEQPEVGSPAAFVRRAFDMRDLAVELGDQPYGAVIADASGNIVAQAPSQVIVNGDPTAHAEMEAIRDAARRLGTRDLSGHTMFSSSRPCPMCEAAAYWANLSAMVYGLDGTEAGAPRLCG